MSTSLRRNFKKTSFNSKESSTDQPLAGSQYLWFVRGSLEKIVSPIAASQLDTISSENILKLNLTPTIPPSSETIPEDCGDDRIYDIEVRDPQTSVV